VGHTKPRSGRPACHRHYIKWCPQSTGSCLICPSAREVKPRRQQA